MPSGACTSSKIWISGIITAWYGMNSPNRKNVNTKSAPGKRHFASTKPFSEPRRHERIVAGIASLKLLPSAWESPFCPFQASCQASSVQLFGSAQAWLASLSSSGLKLLTTGGEARGRERHGKKKQ